MASIVGISFALFTCNSQKSHDNNPPQAMADTTVVPHRGFIIPLVPVTLDTPGQRADYLAAHYWDNFAFNDTTYIHLPGITEQALVDFLDILPHADKSQACFSIAAMLDKAAKEDPTAKMYAYFLTQLRSYLYDPNSPMRNDEFYIPVVEYILKDSVSGQADKQRAGFDLSVMLKNRMGRAATDITYTRADGRSAMLYDLKRNYTILYFYDPDCQACTQTTAHMQNSPLLEGMLKAGILDILALYTGNDVNLWKNHREKIPELWINAYDRNFIIKDKLLYDLKAMPTLYLLDKDKKVLFKDVNVESIEQWLGKELRPGN
jgi:hypothetical protein